jgi:hypothetical protein
LDPVIFTGGAGITSGSNSSSGYLVLCQDCIILRISLKHEKSLRFLAEGYCHTCHCYQYLQSKPEAGQQSETATLMEEDAPSHSVSNVTDDSVEVELLSDVVDSSDNRAALWRAVVPPPLTDMIYCFPCFMFQCSNYI